MYTRIAVARKITFDRALFTTAQPPSKYLRRCCCMHFSRWLEGDWRLIFEVIGRWLEVIGGDWPGSPPQRTLQFACVLQHFHTSAIPRNCREQIPFIKLKRSKEKTCARVVRRYVLPSTHLLRILQGAPYVLFILCLWYVCVGVSLISSIAGII